MTELGLFRVFQQCTAVLTASKRVTTSACYSGRATTDLMTAARRPSIPVLNGRARLIRPTAKRATYQITYHDPITRKRKIVSGGRTEAGATAKALALIGEYVPDTMTPGAQAPTVQQAVDDWIDTNRSRWNSRTTDHYQYQSRKLTSLYSDHTVSSITGTDIKRIDTSSLTRGEQQCLRRIIRGVFTHVEQWIHVTPDALSQAVSITGTKDDSASRQVSRGDIPSVDYVNSLITTCYTTLNQFTRDNGTKVDVSPHDFNAGAPAEMISKLRRGIPHHYRHLDDHQAKEDGILRSRFQQFGLIFALIAGAGLRIGEILALRARHFFPDADDLTSEYLFLSGNYETEPLFLNYRGNIDISEQASQASRGAIYLTAPKMTRTRTVWIPPILPAGGGYHIYLRNATTRERAAEVVPRFQDPKISMWTMTRAEALNLWMTGQLPTTYMLWMRLHEMWNSKVVQSQPTFDSQVSTFRSLLLFPTRNPIRHGGVQPNIRYSETWSHDVRIVPGTGGYQSSTNLSGRYLNPLFDYVSAKIGGEATPYYPAHRTNRRTGRKGWTCHGLRHYAISSWLASPLVPLPQVSAQAGHKNIGFTLDRYGHLMDDVLTRELGFEI